MRIIKAGNTPASLFLLITFALSSFHTLADSVENANHVDPASGLSAALRATMAHNPAVKGKRAELNEQEFSIETAKAKRLPTFSAQANNVNDNFDQGTLRLDQPLWAFGKIDTGIDFAKASFNAEQWSLLQVQRQLIEETAAAYARIEGIRQRQLVAQDNIKEHQLLHQRIERRQKGQLASEADVRLAYSRLLQADAQRQRIEGELLVAHSDLQALTQINVATTANIDETLALLPSRVEVESQALAQSAEVRFKRHRLEVVRLDVKNEKLSSMPTIFLRVEHDALDSASGVDDTRIGLSVESSFEGLGFVTRGRVKGAEARLQAAQYDLDTSANEVRRSINNLMLNRNVQQGLECSQSLAVEAVEATMASFLRQYRSGRKSWVEVLNTQRELTELRLQLVQIKNDWLILSLRVAAEIGVLDQQAGLSFTDKQMTEKPASEGRFYE